jgi:hypothetical protein
MFEHWDGRALLARALWISTVILWIRGRDSGQVRARDVHNFLTPWG